MPQSKPANNFHNSKNTPDDVNQTRNSLQGAVTSSGSTIDEHSEEAKRGLAITQEQISDVYNAGTSDGILILEGGVIVNLKED